MANNFNWSQYEEKPKSSFNWDNYKEDGEIEQEKTYKEPESFGQKALRYGVKDPLVGLASLGHGLLNAPHNLAALFSEKLASHIPKQDEFDYGEAVGLPKEQNLADSLIQAIPELAVTLGLPAARLGTVAKGAGAIPKVGKTLQKALSNKYVDKALGNAITQGTFAASQSPDDQLEAGGTAAGIAAPFAALAEGATTGSPALRTAAKALLGGGAGYLGYEGAKGAGLSGIPADIVAALTGALGYKGFSPKKQAAQQMLEGVEGTEYKSMLDAAKRLDLPYITPAEASGNPYVGAAQGNIGKTKKASQLLYEKGEDRAAGEQKSINKLLDTIFTKEKLEPEVKALYKKAYEKTVPEEALTGIQDNEVFKRALRMVQNKPAFKESLKNVPENSIAYLDHVKQALDDMIEKAPSKEGRIMTKTRKDLLNMTDEIAPEYKEARELAQREITRRDLEKVFNKKPMTGSNFSKFLENQKEFNSLMGKLKNVPEAQEQLKDMKKVFKNLINIPTAKTAEALSRTSMSKDRSDAQALLFKFKEMLSGGKFDKHAVELITNPKWADELKNLKSISKPEKLFAQIFNLVSKAGAQIGAKQVTKPMELELTEYNLPD